MMFNKSLLGDVRMLTQRQLFVS